MLFVLWDYGIPSIFFTLLPGHGSLQAMMGEWWHGIQMQNPLCDVYTCRPHPPLLAQLFCQPSMPPLLLTLWRSWLSHSHPTERLKRRWAISPLSAFRWGCSWIASMPSACCPGLSVLLLLTLAKAHTLMLSPFVFVYVVRRFNTCRQGKQFSWNVVTCIVCRRALRAIAGCRIWLETCPS